MYASMEQLYKARYRNQIMIHKAALTPTNTKFKAESTTALSAQLAIDTRYEPPTGGYTIPIPGGAASLSNHPEGAPILGDFITVAGVHSRDSIWFATIVASSR